MSNEVDYYDVQQMIRDARHEIRAEIREAIMELRENVHARLQTMGDELDALERVLNSRTEHLA